jgi:hypothetical protein
MNRIVIAVLIFFSGLAHCQTPIYCQPDVIKAMGRIFMESANGTSGIEAAFVLNGTPEAYTIYMEPATKEKMQQNIYTWPNTFAVVHVHPNASGEYPSTPTNNYAGNGMGDTGMADKIHADIYVVSSRGLTVYYPATKNTTMLRRNFEWYNAKNCK